MKKTLFRAVLTATLCAQLSTLSFAQTSTTGSTSTDVERLIQHRNYKEATSRLETALKMASTDSDKAELLLLLAKVTERIGASARNKSVESVTRSRLAAVAIDDQIIGLPGATPAQKIQAHKHAILYLKMEGKREVANRYRKSLIAIEELSPKERASMLQELASQTEDKDEAVGYLEQAGSLPDLSDIERAFILLKTGQTLISSGRLELAAKSFTAVDEMPGLQPSWRSAAGLGLAEVALAQGRVKPASERIRALVAGHDVKDVTQSTVLTLAKSFRDAGDPETFIFLTEYLSQSPPKPGNQTENASLELADYYASEKQMDKAHRTLQKLPPSQRVIVKDLKYYHDQGQPDRLAQRFAQIVSQVKEARAADPNEKINTLWRRLPSLATGYLRQYSQPGSKKAAVSLLRSFLEFYPPDTAQGKAIVTEITRVEGL